MTARGTRSAAPDGALVERFAQALDRLWPQGGRLGLAVSGGPDSLAMLLLAEAAIPGRFEVATVDHGLRPESAGECAMVARICAVRDIPCAVLPVIVQRGNLQDAARSARYAILGAWAEQSGLSALATAHHADDQAETLLMRLNRGSGVAGLAGVREQLHLPTFDGSVIRPLLYFRRSELAELVAASGLMPVHDPSNMDDRFDRARIRKALANSIWLNPLAMAASASNLADADEALDWAAKVEWTGHVTGPAEERRYRRSGTPRAIAVRVIEMAIGTLGGQPRGGDVARLIEKLEAGQGGNLAGVHASVEGDEWVFRRESPRRSG